MADCRQPAGRPERLLPRHCGHWWRQVDRQGGVDDRHSPATTEWLQPAYERSLVGRLECWPCTPASRRHEEVAAVDRHGGDHKSGEKGQRNNATLIRGNAPLSARAGLCVTARSAPLIAPSPRHRANPRPPPRRRASATPPTGHGYRAAVGVGGAETAARLRGTRRRPSWHGPAPVPAHGGRCFLWTLQRDSATLPEQCAAATRSRRQATILPTTGAAGS